MPELIDKSLLIAYLAAIKPESYVSAYGEAAVDVINHVETYVNEMPTIGPEVRHGRMIEGRYPNENKCSECGKMFRDDIKFIIQDEDGVFHNPSRCPECGCYWDGGADNG